MMLNCHSAFISATPVVSRTHSVHHVTSRVTKDLHRVPIRARIDPICAKEAKPVTENAWTAILSRARHDTSLVTESLQRLIPEKRFLAALGVAVLLALSSGTEVPRAFAEVPSTVPSTAFYDDVSVVPKGTAQLFGKAADSIANNTGFHVRFVIVRSLPFGSTPNDYAQQLASDWQLGDKDILFVASVKLARAGVYVGEAARSILKDDVAKSIAEETFGIPAGDERYGAGLLDVSNRLIPVLGGEADPGPPIVSTGEVVQNFKTKTETKNERNKYIKVVGGVLIIALVAPLIQTYWYVRDD